MNNISGFFQKFFNLENNNNLRIEFIIKTIKDFSGIDVKREELETSEQKVKINCPPAFRNQIFMHKDKIEESLRSQKIFLKIF